MGEDLRIESSIAKSELDNGSLASRIRVDPFMMMLLLILLSATARFSWSRPVPYALGWKLFVAARHA